MKPQDKSFGVVLTNTDPMIVGKRIMDQTQRPATTSEQAARIVVKQHGGGKLVEELGDGIARICLDCGSVYVVFDNQITRPDQAAIDVAFWLVQKVNDKVDTSKQPVMSYQLREQERGLFVLTEISSVTMMPAQFMTLVSSTEIRDIHAALINLL